MLRTGVLLLLIFALTENTWACPGLESERAQEQEASILFEARPVAYELGTGIMQQPNATSDNPPTSLARVTFKVTKQILGEKRGEWVAIMRGTGLPKSLKDFTMRFSSHLRVGLRDFSGKIDQNKMPTNLRNLPFIVDAACSMNGEDWLLRPIPR